MGSKKFTITVKIQNFETNIANLWDPIQWIHLYCTLPYFNILYCWPDDGR